MEESADFEFLVLTIKQDIPKSSASVWGCVCCIVVLIASVYALFFVALIPGKEEFGVYIILNFLIHATKGCIVGSVIASATICSVFVHMKLILAFAISLVSPTIAFFFCRGLIHVEPGLMFVLNIPMLFDVITIFFLFSMLSCETRKGRMTTPLFDGMADVRCQREIESVFLYDVRRVCFFWFILLSFCASFFMLGPLEVYAAGMYVFCNAIIQTMKEGCVWETMNSTLAPIERKRVDIALLVAFFYVSSGILVLLNYDAIPGLQKWVFVINIPIVIDLFFIFSIKSPVDERVTEDIENKILLD